MKKLKLNLTQKAGEILTREDLKKALGGIGSEGGSIRSIQLTCANGKSLSITDCHGECSSGSDWIKCTGSNNTLSK